MPELMIAVPTERKHDPSSKRTITIQAKTIIQNRLHSPNHGVAGSSNWRLKFLPSDRVRNPCPAGVGYEVMCTSCPRDYSGQGSLDAFDSGRGCCTAAARIRQIAYLVESRDVPDECVVGGKTCILNGSRQVFNDLRQCVGKNSDVSLSMWWSASSTENPCASPLPIIIQDLLDRGHGCNHHL